MKMKKRLLSLLLAAVLAASLALPAAAARDSYGRFSDISVGPTAKAVESLRLMGVLDGYANGTFRPEGQLNRAQFCKMAVCAMNAENQLGAYRTVTVFPDVKPSHWAAAYINMAAKGKNIISGYPDGKFYPDRTVSLGQAVTILLRMLGYQDEAIGGVWPASYMSAAARIKLTDGVESTNPSAPLTRKDAAQLFVNLLRSDCIGGEEGAPSGAFLSTLGLKLEENVVLVSSTAVGPDGKATALQTAAGSVYQLNRDTISSGVLNGCKGTLVLKNNKVVTFLPDAEGSSRVVVLASAKINQITDTSGATYAVTSDTRAYYNGEEKTWADAQSWLNPGRSLTLYMGPTGGVEYVFVGGGGSASEAVIVYEKGSAKGLSALVGGVTGYKIYKNGSAANVSDLRPYDVATYSGATNTIRVCDTRLTGFYESCSPSPAEPTKIVVMGTEFSVLTTAQSTLSKFKPGDQITLLLTEDNQVAGAVKPGTAGASANAIGIVKEASKDSIEVELLCGLSLKGATTLSDNAVNLIKGQPVQVSSDRKGYLGVARLSGGVSGNLNLETRKLGSHSLASTVKVYEYTKDGLEPTSLSALGAGPIPNGQISYAHLNWANQVDVLVLGGIHDGAVFYGRTSVDFEEVMMQDPATGILVPDPTKEPTYFMSVTDGKTTIGPFRLTYDIPGGTYVQATVSSNGIYFSSLKELNRLKDVSNNAWTGQGAVTVEGRTYTISSSVICYNRDNGTWLTLDQAHAYADQADLYASDDGVIRAIEVRTQR